jgi:hypothetical protein
VWNIDLHAHMPSGQSKFAHKKPRRYLKIVNQVLDLVGDVSLMVEDNGIQLCNLCRTKDDVYSFTFFRRQLIFPEMPIPCAGVPMSPQRSAVRFIVQTVNNRECI